MLVSRISCACDCYVLHPEVAHLLRLSCIQADGYLARKYNMGSVLGSILDPAADKALVTTLVVTLTVRGLVPRTSARVWSLQPSPDTFGPVESPVPLGVIILGRDVLLSLSAFWIRWRTLPPPVGSWFGPSYRVSHS